MIARTCEGCDTPLPPQHRPGRQRKWCSERCRKAQYSRPCVDCGKPLNGSDGPDAHKRCDPCNRAHQYAMMHDWILDSFRAWHEMFGQAPASYEWMPTSSTEARMPGTIAQYEATGRPWPWPYSVERHFGSWNAGVAAAGFEPTPRGYYRDESKRRRKATA